MSTVAGLFVGLMAPKARHTVQSRHLKKTRNLDQQRHEAEPCGGTLPNTDVAGSGPKTFRMNGILNMEDVYTSLIPTLIFVALQLWAILGTPHHPITSVPSAATEFNAAIVSLAQFVKRNPMRWPYPDDMGFVSLMGAGEDTPVTRLGHFFVLQAQQAASAGSSNAAKLSPFEQNFASYSYYRMGIWNNDAKPEPKIANLSMQEVGAPCFGPPYAGVNGFFEADVAPGIPATDASPWLRAEGNTRKCCWNVYFGPKMMNATDYFNVIGRNLRECVPRFNETSTWPALKIPGLFKHITNDEASVWLSDINRGRYSAGKSGMGNVLQDDHAFFDYLQVLLDLAHWQTGRDFRTVELAEVLSGAACDPLFNDTGCAVSYNSTTRSVRYAADVCKFHKNDMLRSYMCQSNRTRQAIWDSTSSLIGDKPIIDAWIDAVPQFKMQGGFMPDDQHDGRRNGCGKLTLKMVKSEACQQIQRQNTNLEKSLRMKVVNNTWPGWTPTDQSAFLLDVVVLSKLASAEQVFARFTKIIMDASEYALHGGGDLTDSPTDTRTYAEVYADSFSNWPKAYVDPSTLMPLLVTLRRACQSKRCPPGVLLFLNDAIGTHNTDPETGQTPRFGKGSFSKNLPSKAALLRDTLKQLRAGALREPFETIERHNTQQRVCYSHGCLAVNTQPLIRVDIVEGVASQKGTTSNYVHINDASDVVSAYGSAGASTTLHWLWRMQANAPGKDGISFDLFKLGNDRMRVFVKTKQEYEPGWIIASWSLFSVRLLLSILVEVIACAVTIKTTTNTDEVEVAFLECAPSKATWLIVGICGALDFANILNPVFNPTPSQQGNFLFEATILNSDLVTLMGLTSTKLELGVLPAMITIVGRTVTGDNDTTMEAFLYQIAILVVPIVLAKLGYGFEINTSTICLGVLTATVFVRYANRCLNAPLHWKVWCSDDTMADLQAEPPDICLKVSLGEAEPCGDFIADRLELDTVSLIRSITLGLNIHHYAYEQADAKSGAPAAMVVHQEGALVQSSAETPTPRGSSTHYRMWAEVDFEYIYTMLIPLSLTVILQLMLIFTSGTFPVTQAPTDSASILSSTIVALAKKQSSIDSAWPIPSSISFRGFVESNAMAIDLVKDMSTLRLLDQTCAVGPYFSTSTTPPNNCYVNYKSNIVFYKPTDYYRSIEKLDGCVPSTRSIPLKVQNLTSLDTPGGTINLFNVINETEVQQWYDEISSEISDEYNMTRFLEVFDASAKVKVGMSLFKEMVPQIMANGLVCRDGLASYSSTQGSDKSFYGEPGWNFVNQMVKISLQSLCSQWKREYAAAERLMTEHAPVWPGWKREEQLSLLMDVVKLAGIVTIGPSWIIDHLALTWPNWCGTVVDLTIEKQNILEGPYKPLRVGTRTALFNMFKRGGISVAPRNDPDHSIGVALALSLYKVCVKYNCPLSAIRAAAAAIPAHNTDIHTSLTPRYGLGTLSPYLPQAKTLNGEVRKRAIKAVGLQRPDTNQVHLWRPIALQGANNKQQRICMLHGCIAAGTEEIITVQEEDTDLTETQHGALTQYMKKQFVHLRAREVAQAGDGSNDNTTLHWLWRLQDAEPSGNGQSRDGVSFDVFSIPNDRRLRVYVITKQVYEASWYTLTLVMFGMRLFLYLLVDCFCLAITVHCKEEDIEGDTLCVDFLECVPSIWTHTIVWSMLLLDFANILHPIYNPTSVQQGMFRYECANTDMATLVGLSGTKLELALVPSAICVFGRMYTGDGDTTMEAFAYQMLILTAPLVLGKLGYSFVLNLSTIILCGATLCNVIRWALRMRTMPEHTKACCSDATIARLQLPMHRQAMTLLLAGDLPEGCSAEVDSLCRARFLLLGIPTNLNQGRAKHELGCAINLDDTASKAQDSFDNDAEPFFVASEVDSNSDAVLTSDEWHALTSRLFRLYDLDCSGTLNSNEEMDQLTTNITVKLTTRYPNMSLPSLHTIDATLATLDPISDTNAWTLEKFQEWYIREFVAERDHPK